MHIRIWRKDINLMQIYLNLHEMGYQRMNSLGTFYCPCNIINCVSITDVEVKNTRSWNEYIFIIAICWLNEPTRSYIFVSRNHIVQNRRLLYLWLYNYVADKNIGYFPILIMYYIAKVKVMPNSSNGRLKTFVLSVDVFNVNDDILFWCMKLPI